MENQLSFLDAFLKGEDSKGWTIPGRVPPIDMLVRKGEPAVGNATQEAEIFGRRAEYEWPLARTQYETFHLTAESALSQEPAEDETTVFEYKAPQ